MMAWSLGRSRNGCGCGLGLQMIDSNAIGYSPDIATLKLGLFGLDHAVSIGLVGMGRLKVCIDDDL